jgi:hypothetical protein
MTAAASPLTFLPLHSASSLFFLMRQITMSAQEEKKTHVEKLAEQHNWELGLEKL